MDPADVHPRVKEAVRAWAHAANIERSAHALAEARGRLPPELVAQLVDEVAEISAELMVELVTRADGVDTTQAPVDVLGVPLLPKQAERLGAWLEDQQLVAGALGLDSDAWLRQLERGFERYGQRVTGASAADAATATDVSDDVKRMLGNARGKFEARPAPGTSRRAGLSGLLAARGFKKKKKNDP